MDLRRLNSSSYFSDHFSSSDSENEDEDFGNVDTYEKTIQSNDIELDMCEQQNIIYKLLNREKLGYFSNSSRKKINQLPFVEIPDRCRINLAQVLPRQFFVDHVFMGLTVCGKFVLSYQIKINDVLTNDITTHITYKLHYWIIGQTKFRKYCTISLFDDQAIQNFRTVTIAQWKTNPWLLIAHGTSEFESEDYLTITAVPRLGCSECQKIRNEYGASDILEIRCTKCNLTVHTKYSRTESDPKFDPKINLNCPNMILIITDGLIHMLNVTLEYNNIIINNDSKLCSNSLSISYLNKCDNKTSTAVDDVRNDTDRDIIGSNPLMLSTYPSNSNGCERNDIVARIIADFDECESMDSNHHHSGGHDPISKPTLKANHFEELRIYTQPVSVKREPRPPVRLLSYRAHERAANKLMQQQSNSVLEKQPCSSTVVSSTSSKRLLKKTTVSTATTDKAANAYEFSEDNEKYEKISSFRKRCLADKKYAFSEDNSENIIPFTKIRSIKSGNSLQFQSRINNISKAIPTPPIQSTQPHYLFNSSGGGFFCQSPNNSSPSHSSFRSPCGSPVSNRFMRSPPYRSPHPYSRSPTNPYYAAMSPRHTMNSRIEVSLLSPRSDDSMIKPLSEVKPSNIGGYSTCLPSENRNGNDENKPMCSKRLIRHYVEDDDAISVITSEEDDCISPGYHSSLPVQVHGSGYSEMQMISKISYQKLKCPVATITQNTFDLETFTYYIANYICSVNKKKFGFFCDWASEILTICPISSVITCILIVQFTAKELQSTPEIKQCPNCTGIYHLECAIHRRHYECRTFFTWNIDSGELSVLDYGDMIEIPPPVTSTKRNGVSDLTIIVRKLANELLSPTFLSGYNTTHLRILDSNNAKSKELLYDPEHCIQLYLNVSNTIESVELGVMEAIWDSQ